MTMEERAEKAVALKSFGGYNCAQAVAAVLADKTELSPQQLAQLTAGFGAGMGTMEATCGALIGACVVAGLQTQGRGTSAYSRRLIESFREACGAVACKDLKHRTDGVPLCPCEDCVKNAVLAYGAVLEEKKTD